MNRPPCLLVLGLSHRTAQVELRERLAFRAEETADALHRLLKATAANEAAILSTCNRVELYLSGAVDASELDARARGFLAEFHGLDGALRASLDGALFAHHEGEAARHLFEVASSIDSQILGETEIQAQTKEAYRLAAEHGAAGPVLRRLFERALALARQVRADGGIGRAQASVSSAAVQLARHLFEDLRGHRVLVLGTGEMARGIVRALKNGGVADVLVVSRTLERAEEFAKHEGGRCGKLEDLDAHLAAADIVLVSTAAPHYLLRVEHMERAHQARRGRPLFVIDIAVPRNVDPRIHELPDTFLYDIDDLEEVAEEGRRQREEVARRWAPRLRQEADALLHEWRDRAPDEAAKELLKLAEALRGTELERLRASGLRDPEALAQLERALERFQGRLLHGALAALKEATRAGDGATAAHWVQRIFRLGAGSGAHDAPAEAPPQQAAEPERNEAASDRKAHAAVPKSAS
ncbi:MAG: glutamyl-tRNA reductase [Planctomycetota bacterium]|nr:glutamyl-tRNA reductase [Planctomycetota bacterium]